MPKGVYPHIKLRGRKISPEALAKRFGRKHSPEAKKRISLAKLGNKNPNWGGDNVGYSGIHKWANQNKKRNSVCDCCGKKPSYAIALDLANISLQYKRDVDDWEWLCRRCHMIKDGRLVTRKNNGTFAPIKTKIKPRVRRKAWPTPKG